ncbi:hypothetical protein [Streptomyces longhuiensis]|uniref:hypothetical protein n=1 Tax=Streptomyces longhuiensis TaxID=2880933 RepID=UPI001D0B0783|nr:hypothetical protein [Streptomyces longhuiensis]UDM05522.1 hypothetical protein LGI35_45580 [Streptomyces longhuiensis]
MTSHHPLDAPGPTADARDETDVEEMLRAEARAVDDMVFTHDTDDFMRRLAHGIADQAALPPRVRRAAAPADGDRAREPSTARHDMVRPRSRRTRRRRPTPVVRRNPLSDPRVTRAYLLKVCETVLCTADEEHFELYESDGARTFACMLYLLGRRHSAVFWWGFAAGADDPLAAHLLATHYAINNTSLQKARVWRWYSRLLGYRSRRHLPHLIQDSERPREQIAADLATNYPWPQVLRTFIDNPRLIEM